VSLSREPVVWRTGLAGLLAALVTVGVLAQPAADQVSGGLDALLVAVNALLPVIAGVLARGKVVPTTATEPVQALIRGSDGVYRPTGRLVGDSDQRGA
jgi:hypothetical protein